MYQTLFYIPSEVAGVPVFGFGLLLILWAAASIAWMAWLVARQGFCADTWSYVPLLALVGAVIAWLAPAISKPEGLPIRGYGTMVMLGVVAGTWLAAWRARRVGIDAEQIYSLVFWMLIPGILGARAFYVIEYWPEYWRHFTAPGGGLGPLIGQLLNITEGGLVVYGSLIGGAIGLGWFARRRSWPVLAVCDLLVPSMFLGLAIGRVGCLLNGCCFGGVCDGCCIAITFPPQSPPYEAQVRRGQMHGLTLDGDPASAPTVRAVAPGGAADRAGLKPGQRLKSINGLDIAATGDAFVAMIEAYEQHQAMNVQIEDGSVVVIPAVERRLRSLPVYPTQPISSINALALCLICLAYDRLWRRRDGELLALMLSLYPAARFCIECLRNDEAPVFGTGMSIAQNVSLLLLVCAAALWAFILRRPPGLAFARPDVGASEDVSRNSTASRRTSSNSGSSSRDR